MQEGTIKFFNETKGYGFIEPDGGGKDVFVHITAFERAGLNAPSEGERWQFEVEKDRRGRLQASTVAPA